MRGFLSGLVFVAFAVLVAVDAGVVRAQSSADAAQEAVTRGEKAYAAGRLPEAIEEYKRAYELSGDLSLLFRLGEVCREVGQDVAAVRFYRTYLARDPRGKYREAAERAARNLDLKGEQPAANAAAPPSVPPPAPREAARGARTAAVARAAVTPAPAAAPAPAPAAPPSPARPRDEAPAPVDLRSERAPAPASQAGPPLPRWLPWAGLGVSLGLGAGAVVSGLGASHRYNELRGSCGRTTEGCAQGDIDQVRSRALTANLLWAGAAVGAAATGVMVFVNTREAGVSGVWSF